MQRRLWPILVLTSAVALGCGLLGPEPEPESEPEPLPVIIPPSLVGTWWGTQQIDDRPVLVWACDTAELTRLDMLQGGPIKVAGPRRTFSAGLTMATLESDGSVTLTTEAGVLKVTDRDEGIVYARGSVPGFPEGMLLANPDNPRVEQLFMPADQCGETLDTTVLKPLAERDYNATGDPCVSSAMKLSLSKRSPTMMRAGLTLGIEQVHPADDGTWITLADASGGLHGLRVAPQDDGSVRVFQRLSSGMAMETLKPVRGYCDSMDSSLPTGAERMGLPPVQQEPRKLR